MKNAETLSAPAAGQIIKSDGEKFVVFFLSDELFAVRASAVEEVMELPPLTALPNSPAWLHGIANLRGAVITVLNLARLCSKPSVNISPKTKLVVLKPQNLAAPIAFPVDRLSEMITLAEQDIKQVDHERFVGKAFYQSVSVTLLNAENLFFELP